MSTSNGSHPTTENRSAQKEESLVVNRGKSTFSVRLVTMSLEENVKELISLLDTIVDALKIDEKQPDKAVSAHDLSRLLNRIETTRDFLLANELDLALDEWNYCWYMGLPVQVEAKQAAHAIANEIKRKRSGRWTASLDQNASELRQHCEIMWQGLQESKIENWWGVQYCMNYIDQQKYEEAADSLLSMYGGMGSFLDVYVTRGPGGFYESQAKAYDLAIEIQLKFALQQRSLGNSNTESF